MTIQTILNTLIACERIGYPIPESIHADEESPSGLSYMQGNRPVHFVPHLYNSKYQKRTKKYLQKCKAQNNAPKSESAHRA